MALTREDLQAISCLLDTKMDEKLAPVHDRLDNIDSRLNNVDNRLDGLESKFDRLENRVDKIESQVSALTQGQIELRKEVNELNIKVSDTYDLALEAWGKSTENRHWLENDRQMKA